ncbi:hypothetical protein QR680_013797 [Steinernema hermaphroditum]|uniref:Insulin-like domain-containing protein n=1 Tax=Steinernema hermaphroditum TaxID=289476 RepID=A0AA39M2V3_9BILA|nr:hypothetical protein QR680_013797 [Steinernema hermaphroditum]
MFLFRSAAIFMAILIFLPVACSFAIRGDPQRETDAVHIRTRRLFPMEWVEAQDPRSSGSDDLLYDIQSVFNAMVYKFKRIRCTTSPNDTKFTDVDSEKNITRYFRSVRPFFGTYGRTERPNSTSCFAVQKAPHRTVCYLIAVRLLFALFVPFRSSVASERCPMKTLFVVILLLVSIEIDCRHLMQHGLRQDTNAIDNVLDDDITAEFFTAISARKRRDVEVGRYLCGTELISPMLTVCNGCLLNKTETEARKLFGDVSLLCCHGKCSEKVLKTLCC